MKKYTIAPNNDATAWFVKIEDVALYEQFDKYDKAIEAGENVAEENKPSTLTILDKDHNVLEERTFQ